MQWITLIISFKTPNLIQHKILIRKLNIGQELLKVFVIMIMIQFRFCWINPYYLPIEMIVRWTLAIASQRQLITQLEKKIMILMLVLTVTKMYKIQAMFLSHNINPSLTILQLITHLLYWQSIIQQQVTIKWLHRWLPPWQECRYQPQRRKMLVASFLTKMLLKLHSKKFLTRLFVNNWRKTKERNRPAIKTC